MSQVYGAGRRGRRGETDDVRDELRAQPKFKIFIPSTETNREPVPAGVNGYTFQISRDVEVVVPAAVVEVLNNAKMTVFKQRRREDGEGNELVPTLVPRHQFQVLGEAVPDQVMPAPQGG